MLGFIIGVLVGAIISFFVFAVFSMAGSNDRNDDPCSRKTGEDDAGK